MEYVASNPLSDDVCYSASLENERGAPCRSSHSRLIMAVMTFSELDETTLVSDYAVAVSTMFRMPCRWFLIVQKANSACNSLLNPDSIMDK